VASIPRIRTTIQLTLPLVTTPPTGYPSKSSTLELFTLPSVDLFQSTVIRPTRGQPTDAPALEVELGHTNPYATWIADPERDLYEWKDFDAVNPNSVGYGINSGIEVGYNLAGFCAQPVLGTPTPLVAQPADDELQTWFDFNGFGNQNTTGSSGEAQNVEIVQFNETSWNAFAYAQH